MLEEVHEIGGVHFTVKDTYLGMALVLARQVGWKVFPLRPSDKRPLSLHGFHDATLDPKQIEAWWRAEPNAGIGVATGSPSGVVVLDVDPRNGGRESVHAIVAQYGALPDTVVCQTGGGGQHYYFRLPPDEVAPSSKPFAGIDLKADGGYVVVPPSFHPSGVVYRWEGKFHPDRLAPCPEWLLAILRSGQQRLAKEAIPGRDDTENGWGYRLGARNSSLASLAGTMRRRGFGVEAIQAALLVENTARCIPPLSDSEVSAIAASVARYEPEATAVPPTSPPSRTHHRFLDLHSALLAPPPEVNWFLDGWLAHGDISLIAGVPGSGKSWFVLDLAIGAALGRSVWDHFPQEGFQRVLLVDEENPLDEVKRRLWLVSRAYGISPDEIKHLVENILVTLPRQGFSFRSQASVQWLYETIRAHRPTLIIFDSVTAINTVVEEGNPIQVRQFFHDQLAPLQSLVPGQTPTILLVHHTNKLAYRLDPEVENAGLVRGSIDYLAAPDSVFLLAQKDSALSLINLKPRRGKAPSTLKMEVRDIVADETGEFLGVRPVVIDESEGSALSHAGQVDQPWQASVLLALQDGEFSGSDLEVRTRAMGSAPFTSRKWYKLLECMVLAGLICCRPNNEDRRKKIYSLPELKTDSAIRPFSPRKD